MPGMPACYATGETLFSSTLSRNSSLSRKWSFLTARNVYNCGSKNSFIVVVVLVLYQKMLKNSSKFANCRQLGRLISRTFHFPRECGIEYEFPAGNAGNAGNTRYVLNEGKNTWKTFWTTFQSVSQVEWSISRIFMWILNSVLIKSFLRIIWVPDLVQKTSFWIIQFEI